MAAPDTTVASVLATTSKIALDFAQGYTRVRAKQQRVEDATEMAKRAMLAETDLDKITDTIRQDRESHPKAPEIYQEGITDASKRWTENLRPDLAAALTRHMVPKLIEGQRAMRTVKQKYLIDDAQTTLNAKQQSDIDRAGRLDISDEQAFSPMFQSYEHMEGGLPEGAPRTVRAMTGSFPTYIKALVDATLLTSEEGDKRLRETLDAMAYRRLQRMAISDNPGVVQNALDILKREEDSPGSTFASVLKAEHRNGMIQAAQGQRDHLKTQAQQDADRADRLARQREKDINDEQKAHDQGAVGALILGILRGEKGVEDLNRMVIYNHELSTNPVQQEHIQNLIDQKGRQGGTTNWALYNQFRNEIVQSRGAANITSRLLAVTAKPNGIAWDDADKLMTMAATVGERSPFKDDFFQAAQRDIDRALAPQVGIADIGGEKQRRHAEASREFFDRAGPLIQAGKRETLPGLAREITDRFIKNAPKVSVDKRYTPQYESKEETVQAFETLYGRDPKKWSPTVRQEFNRQITAHDMLNPPPTAVPAGEAARDKQSRKPTKLPNPIQ